MVGLLLFWLELNPRFSEASPFFTLPLIPGPWLWARRAFVPPAGTSLFVCTVILSEVWVAVWMSVACTYLLHFFNQMAALICAMATGDARWVRTAGSVSARPAGGGLDATLPWKPPVPITRIMREVSKKSFNSQSWKNRGLYTLSSRVIFLQKDLGCHCCQVVVVLHFFWNHWGWASCGLVERCGDPQRLPWERAGRLGPTPHPTEARGGEHGSADQNFFLWALGACDLPKNLLRLCAQA